MKKPHQNRLLALFGIAALLAGVTTAQAWRSALYPAAWTPADVDGQGRFLHDFSYAGYHKGEVSIPTNPPGSTYTVTNVPYNADNTGSNDATAAIQAAIDDAESAGGGIVYLPAGMYTVSPGGNTYALRISNNGVVLRGAGADQTYICNTQTVMRSKNIILVQPSTGDWHSPLAGSEILASADIDYPTRTVPLVSVSGLNVGDTIIVRADCTADFIADHGMTGDWTSSLKGPTFCRTITSVDAAAKNITIDIPTRYYLKRRDNARIYKVADHVEEVGIEDLSIGMVENTTPGFGDLDYTVVGTGAYEVHYSHAIKFLHARHGWIQRVETYRPAANASDIHTLSNIILLEKSAHITVRNCVVQKPEYEGGGGNGYGYTLRSGDCLITECVANNTRHNYDFKSMWTSGNVVHKSTGSSPRLCSDFHMHLSIANMFDSMTVTGGDYLQAVYRPYGTVLHGHSSTEAVFWNTYGAGSGTAVQSAQWGYGYVIGTSGSQSRVTRGTANNSAPEDFLEGEGSGDTLEPQSLYDDQLAKRMLGVLVNAGADQELYAPSASVPLDGRVYTYGDSAPTTAWIQVSGPAATLSDTNAIDTTVACTNVGAYVFRLNVTDGTYTNHDDVSVTVLDVAAAPLFEDNCESYTAGNDLPVPDKWAQTGYTPFATVRDEGTSTAFGNPNQYLQISDDLGDKALNLFTYASTDALGVVSTIQFDFYEPDNSVPATSLYDDPLLLGYGTGAGFSASQARILVSLDDGVIGSLTGGSSTAYELGTAYTFYLIFNDTGSPVSCMGRTLAAYSAGVWYKPLSAQYAVYAGNTAVLQPADAAGYFGAFRTFTTATQEVWVDNYSLFLGLPPNLEPLRPGTVLVIQ